VKRPSKWVHFFTEHFLTKKWPFPVFSRIQEMTISGNKLSHFNIVLEVRLKISPRKFQFFCLKSKISKFNSVIFLAENANILRYFWEILMMRKFFFEMNIFRKWQFSGKILTTKKVENFEKKSWKFWKTNVENFQKIMFKILKTKCWKFSTKMVKIL